MKNKNILDYLFFCIIINLIPIISLKVLEIPNKIYTILVLFVYAIQTLIMCFVVRKKLKETSKKTIIILLLFFILQIIAQLISYFKWNHFEIQDVANIFSVTINLFLYLYLCAKFEITKDEFISFMKKMIIVGLIACIYNIIVNWGSIINIFNLDYSYSVSISSFFPNRNQFGMFLLIMIMSTLYILIDKRSKGYIALLIVFLINLIWTMSRNAMLGTGVLVILFILFNGKDIVREMTKKQKIIVCSILAILVIIVVVLLFTIPEIWETINRLFIRTDLSDPTAGRMKIWKNGIDILKNNPVIGVGRFQAIYLNNTVYKSLLDQFHNIYIETLVSYGIIGLTGLGYLIIRNIKKVKNSAIDKVTKRLMLSSIIVFLVISFFETTCRFAIGYVDTINMIYFFTIPLIYANIKNEKEVPNELSAKKNAGRRPIQKNEKKI